ncbi:hypothetical protein JCM15124A_21850 [Prevotella falsenii]
MSYIDLYAKIVICIEKTSIFHEILSPFSTIRRKTAAKYHYARVDKQTKVDMKIWPIMRFPKI